jgi:hypothetical protein
MKLFFVYCIKDEPPCLRSTVRTVYIRELPGAIYIAGMSEAFCDEREKLGISTTPPSNINKELGRYFKLEESVFLQT